MSKKSLTILFGVLLVIAACSKAEISPLPMATDAPPPEIQSSPTNTLVKPATATIAPSPTSISATDDPDSSTIGNQNNETRDVSGGMTSPISSNIWNSRDVPPAGVIEQISFIKSGGAGGGWNCSPSSLEPIPQPIIWFGNNKKTIKAEIDSGIDICIEGLGDIESAKIEIKGPSDFQVDYKQFVEDWLENSAPILRISTTPKSGDPLGIYTVNVSSEDGDATAQFEVIRATTPVLWYDGYYGQNQIYRGVGEKFPIYIAGLSSNTDIHFHLFKGESIEEIFDQDLCRYKCNKTNLKYLTTWQQTSDERGEIILELNSEEETSKGLYLLIISSPNAPVCNIEYQDIEEYGDWGSTTCDLVFKIQIGEEVITNNR